MRGLGTQLEQIQLLIDKIQNHMLHSTNFSPYDYEKLLTLSTQIHYSYGQALAYAYLAQYAQVTLNFDAYHLHLDEAKRIARSKNYFDVLIKCAQLQGNCNRALCDEMTALSNYLDGLTLAIETKDMKACFIFYCEIAHLFSDCGAHEDAQEFYQKALDVLDTHRMPNVNIYRQNILICMLRAACIRNDLEHAEQYWNACQNIPHALGELPLLVEEIRLSLLRNDTEAAFQKAEALLHALRQDKSDAIMLQPLYLYTMELMLAMKCRESATWCLRQIDTLYPEVDRKSAIRLQKLRVEYAETFGGDDDGIYQNFYQVAQQGELSNRVSTVETFRSLITLYETAKEQNRMMEERTGLQTAIDRDELTQIYNRRYCSKMISKHLQDDRITSLGCIMIDVDYFKAYNDFYGHPKGDQVLKEVASLLDSCIPQDAYAARYGGDEFSCLFVSNTEREIVSFVERVQKELAKKKISHQKNKGGDFLTLSFGIYHTTNLKDCDEHLLLSRADQALYQAKEKGRNTYAVYTQGGEYNE